MQKPDPAVHRKIFESYVNMAVAGDTVYASHASQSVADAMGRIYKDQDGNLCIAVEHVYLELKPDLARLWLGSR